MQKIDLMFEKAITGLNNIDRTRGHAIPILAAFVFLVVLVTDSVSSYGATMFWFLVASVAVFLILNFRLKLRALKRASVLESGASASTAPCNIRDGDTDIKAVISTSDWDIEVNGVSVGLVSNEQLAKIRYQEYTNKANYLSQAASLLKFAFSAVTTLFFYTPLIAFWYVVAIYAASTPEEMDLLVSMTQTDFQSTISKLIRYYSFVISFSIFIYFIFTYRDNKFENAVALRIRQYLGCAACGKMVIGRRITITPTSPSQMSPI